LRGPITSKLLKQKYFPLLEANQKFMSELLQRTERTTLKRSPSRGSFDRQTIYRILDEAFVCHVGFTIDQGPVVIPTAYARVGNDLLIHGSTVSRMLMALAMEVDICVTVTLIDGLVLARSAFDHSMNYRSVMIFGKARVLIDKQEKTAALRAFTEHIIPRRWDEVRPPNAQELKATTVLMLPLQEVSAKTRTGPPLDNEQDYALDIWAGVIPLKLSAGEPIADDRVKEGISMPPSVLNYR
jgi:nitroimidazol reductase NimA-like FMN-containing flavoprotein (pyridoxamine 5'-phosphate oxidase superfamily)